jgi:MFS family permease
MTQQRLRFLPLDYAACLGFLAYSASATATPIILVNLSRELGFGLTGAGVLEAARSGLIFVTLLGSGFLSAHLGKVRALGSASLFLGVGLLLYSQAPGYAAVVMALALMGVGGGVIEALINPLVEELHRDDAGRYLNFINGFWSVGVLLTMLAGGEVLTRTGEWRGIVRGIAGLSLVCGILFFVLRKTGANRQRLAMREVWGHKNDILRHRGFWLFTGLMLFGGAAEGVFTFWTASYVQLVHGGSPRMAGFAAALFSLGMIVIRFGAGSWIRQHQLLRFVQGSAALGIGVSLVFPFVPAGLLFWVLLFLAGCSVAGFWPSIQALAVERLPLDNTSLFILLSCGGIGGFSFSSWSVGWLAEQTSLDRAFLMVPGLFAVLLLLTLKIPRHPDGSFS